MRECRTHHAAVDAVREQHDVPCAGTCPQDVGLHREVDGHALNAAHATAERRILFELIGRELGVHVCRGDRGCAKARGEEGRERQPASKFDHATSSNLIGLLKQVAGEDSRRLPEVGTR